jgi:hypothetical protein
LALFALFCSLFCVLRYTYCVDQIFCSLLRIALRASIDQNLSADAASRLPPAWNKDLLFFLPDACLALFFVFA